MKANVTYIPINDIISLAREAGLNVEQMKGFWKITGQIPGKSIYPSNTNLVGRIDVSGFGEKILEGTVKHPSPPTKRVTMLVSQEGKDAVTIKETLRRLFDILRVDGVSAEAAE